MNLTLDQYEEIHRLYPQVVKINADVAYNAADNIVQYDIDMVNASIQANSYKNKRAAEYPPITDYLDGIVKGDQAQIDKYIADCQAVKVKYPRM